MQEAGEVLKICTTFRKSSQPRNADCLFDGFHASNSPFIFIGNFHVIEVCCSGQDAGKSIFLSETFSAFV